MKKSEELSRGDSCLNKAKDDELIFVVLERDLAAPGTIYCWVKERVRLSLNEYSDAQIQEALAWAERVRENHFTRVAQSFKQASAAMIPKP